jgi:hypothetical protein
MSDRRQPNDDGNDRAQGKAAPIQHPVTLKLGSRKITLPRSRVVRMGLGIALILGGILGFLPILGFWMLPLGLMVLSVDLPFARRWRRRLTVWWSRRRKEAKNKGDF